MDPDGRARAALGGPLQREGVPGVVCLECFDTRAERADVAYSGALAVMGRGAWLASGEAMEAVRREMGIA